MKLLKAKAFLHGVIFIFSTGVTALMMVEARSNIYPDIFCYICAFISLINVLYSAVMVADCNMEIEEIKARERR